MIGFFFSYVMQNGVSKQNRTVKQILKLLLTPGFLSITQMKIFEDFYLKWENPLLEQR